MPTQLRHAVANTRHHEAVQSRRREMVCNLLTQIFVLAERTRATKARRRSLPDEETEPISLIELIQASYSIFERYGIGPPDDAVYHRYLLSLSINPERDWRKKIFNFDLGTQPRVKRLCRHATTEASSDKLKKVPNADSIQNEVQSRQRRENKYDVVRRASLVSEPSTKKPADIAQHGQHQYDRFGDMLSLDSPIQKIQVGDNENPRRAFMNDNPKASVRPVIPMFEAKEDELTNKANFLTSIGKERAERAAAGERQLQMITTSIEQWRATQAVKQLVNQNKAQNEHSRKQQIVTRCIHAIFHWVTLCLPEKIDFHATQSPRALPLCILRRISVDVKVLKKSAQRVWVWQIKTLLKMWHQNAQQTKRFRVRMMVKQRAAVLETVFQCIQTWRLFTETIKCATDRAQWITQRSSRSRLRMCLQHWRRVFQSRQQHYQVDQHHFIHVMRKVLKSWQKVVELKRDERFRYETTRKRRVLSRWKTETERKQASRALLCVASDQRRLRSLSDSWNKLRANVVRNQSTRTSLNLWEIASRQRRRRQVLCGWKLAIDQSKYVRERVERFHRYSHRRQLSQIFVVWANWTERQMTTAKILSDATEARASKQLSLSFANWRGHFEQASHQEETLVTSVIHLRRKGIWNHWRISTRIRSATRCVDSAYSLHLQTNVFTRWKQHVTKKAVLHFTFLDCQQRHKIYVLAFYWKMLVANMKSQHQKQLAVDQFEANKLRESKRVCLVGWQAHVRGKRACRLRGEHLQHSLCRQNLMHSSWSKWRQAFWLTNVARLADDQLHSYRKSHSFGLWKQFVSKARQRHDRTLKVVEMLGNFHVHACFRQWKDLLTTKHKLAQKSEMVRQIVRTRILTTRWKTWRQTLETQRGQHERLSAAASRWQNRQLYASFHCWKATWSIRKRHHKLLQTTLLTTQQRVLEVHFKAWRKRWQTSAARERQVLKTQDKLLVFKVKRAIRHWNSLRLKHHELNGLLAKSLELWRQTLLSNAFNRLVQYKQIRKQKKSQNQLVRSRYCKQLKQRVFSAWSTWSRCKGRTRRQLETVKQRLDALKMLRTIHKFRHNTHSRKRLRTALQCVVAVSSSHTKIATFSRWKAYIAQKYSNRRDATTRAITMKNFRVRTKIQRWRESVQVRKLLKHTLTRAITVSTASLLQHHLVNWKKFVARQIFTRALKQKATAFRYFCLLPLYFGAWKKFLSTKNHKQELLLRARALWCHQSESRAFKAWTQYAVNNRNTKRAVLKWKNQTISRSFGSWKRFESLQKKKQRDQVRAVNFYERRTCHRVLREWSSTSRHDRLARYCAQMWYENTSRRVFNTWIRHIRLLQSSRKFLAKMRNQTLAQLFIAWKENIKNKAQQLQNIQERFALLWMMDSSQKAFARWKRYALLRNFIRKKFGGLREVLLQNVLKEWRLIVVYRQRSRQCALLVAERSNFALMRAMWNNWRTKARLLRCVKLLRDKVTTNRVTSDLRQRVHRWKKFTVLSIAVKAFAGRKDLELMRLSFVEGFQRFTQRKHKERDLAKQIGCVHEVYLKEWLAIKLQQRMSIIAACEDIRRSGSSMRLLTSAWNGWMEFHAKKQTQQQLIRQLRVQISQLVDRGSILGTTRLARMVRRWKRIQVARTFERWNDVVQSQKQTRLQTLKAMEWWHKMQCKKHFQGWVRCCQQQKKQRRVRAMNVKSKLKRMWRCWQVFKSASLRRKVLNRGANQFHALQMYRISFKTWRKVATLLRLRREQILELYHSSRLRLLAALLSEWRKFAAMEKTKHMQLTVAHVVYQQKIMRKVFTEWKIIANGISYHRRQLQLNTERLQVLLLCSSFRAWNSWTQQHRKLKTFMQMLSTKCDSKAASRVFTAWHLHTEKASRLRHQALSFIHFRRMQKGVKVLRSLAQEQLYLRTIREKAHLFKSTIDGHQITVLFACWKKFATLSRQTRTVTLRYLQNKLLPLAWSAWVSYTKTKREAKGKTLTAALCWKNVFLRKAWNAVVLVHKVKKEHHAKMARAVFHYDNRRLRNTVELWCQTRKENQHFRAVCGKFITRWRLQTAYRCFCAVRDYGIYCKNLRANETMVRTKVRTTTLLRGWYTWRKLIFISRCGKRRLLQRCWTSWIHSRESRKVLQGFRQQIQAQVLRSIQRRCLANWKMFVATRKIEKAMVLMSNAFALTQLLKRIWLCWLRHVTETRRNKLRMRDALAHMHLQLQFKVFRALQAYTSQQKWKTQANIRMLAFRSHRLITCYFLQWKAVAVERIHRRQKLARYVNLMQHSVQKKSYNAWFSLVARRKMLRAKVSNSLAIRTQLCSRMVFQTWKSFATKIQRNRVAQGFSDAKTFAHAIKHWKQYVVLCKIERMIGANEQRQVESSFLSWRKAVAATHRIRAFRAKCARKHWVELVGMVFERWKQQSQTHAHCRKLLASVAVGNHLRFRFMLWQQFTVYRKRLANLLLVVADAPATLPIDALTIECGGGGVDDNIAVKGEICGEERNSSDITVLNDNEKRHSNTRESELIVLGQALAKKARVLQRFEVTWDLPQTWHRWRQIFHAQLFYRMRLQQFYFITWQRFAHQQCRNRFIVIKLSNQRQAASAQTIFRAWAELVGRVKQLHKDRLRERELWVLVNTEMARRERRQLKKHWYAWKFHVEEVHHLQSSLDVYHRARLLTKFWLVWCHDYRQIMSGIRRDTQHIETHMQKFHLHRAIRNVKDHRQRSKRARLVLEYFSNRRYDTLLPEVFSRWWKWCKRQKEVARFVERARMKKKFRHFTVWKVWKNTRKWQRVMVSNLQLKNAKQQRWDVWVRWRRYVKKQIVENLALQRAEIFHVCSRLRKRWFRHTQRAIQLREQTEFALVQLYTLRGHRMVTRWQNSSRSRRLRRLYQRFVLRKHVQLWQSAVKHAVATRFDEFLLHTKAKKMLTAWKQFAVKHQYWRNLCMSFVNKKDTQTTRRVFLQWQQLITVRQGKRLATMHAEKILLQKVWRCWDRFALASQLRRHEQIEQVAKRKALTMLRQSLDFWKTLVKKQRERRFVLLSCVVKLKSVASQRVQEVIFRAWKRVVHHERRCRATLLKRDYKSAKRAFISWLSWTHYRQQRRQQVENAANYYSQRLKSAVFFYWQTYALAWQDAAKPIIRRRNRQMLLPATIASEPRCITYENSDSESDVRRPTSPVVKRLRQKKANRTRQVESVEESHMVTLPDAVEISMDVKKRLLLLGKWKPQKDPSKSKLLSFSS